MKFIPLTRDKVAIVNDEDFDRISRYSWYPVKRNHTTYVHTKMHVDGKWRSVPMHRMVLGCVPGDGLMVDHRNGNGLDNRRQNLRLVTHQQNIQNMRTHRLGRSRYKGVHWDASRNKWRAEIKDNQRKITIGRFSNERDAAIAYDRKAAELFGDYAYLNFPNLIGADVA